MRARRGAGFWAALAHRVSGVLLALFLPAHFLVLGLALDGADPLDRVLAFAELPLVQAAEWTLVILLALHLGLGVRVLALEFLPWRGLGTRWVGASAGLALAAGVVFLLRLG